MGWDFGCLYVHRRESLTRCSSPPRHLNVYYLFALICDRTNCKSSVDSSNFIHQAAAIHCTDDDSRCKQLTWIIIIKSWNSSSLNWFSFFSTIRRAQTLLLFFFLLLLFFFLLSDLDNFQKGVTLLLVYIKKRMFFFLFYLFFLKNRKRFGNCLSLKLAAPFLLGSSIVLLFGFRRDSFQYFEAHERTHDLFCTLQTLQKNKKT